MKNQIYIPNQRQDPPKQKGTMVHVSVETGMQFGVPFRTKCKTFVGSIRDKFTGPRRNNFGQIH